MKNQKNKMTIYLGDLAYSNDNTYNEVRNPLGAGYIATYIKNKFRNDISIKLFKDPAKLVDACIDKVPDLIGLSFYAWNTNLNKCTIEFIKKHISKDIYVAWGGPSVDTDIIEQKRIFHKYPDVDFLIENEGELGFSNIVEAFLSKNNVFEDKILLKQFNSAKNLLELFRQGKLSSSQVFNIKKMAKFLAMIELFGAHHSTTLYSPSLRTL